MNSQSASYDLPKNPSARRWWLVVELRKRNLTVAAFARRHGVTPAAMSHAMVSPSARLERAIARVVGAKVNEIFPERYDASGRRIVPVRRRRVRPSVVAS